MPQVLSSFSSLIVLSSTGGVLHLGGEAERLWGRETFEAGKDWLGSILAPDEDFDAVRSAVEVLGHGPSEVRFEVVCQNRQGRPFLAELTWSAWWEGDDLRIMMLATPLERPEPLPKLEQEGPGDLVLWEALHSLGSKTQDLLDVAVAYGQHAIESGDDSEGSIRTMVGQLQRARGLLLGMQEFGRAFSPQVMAEGREPSPTQGSEIIGW